MTAVPISMRLVRAPIAASSGNGDASWGEVVDAEVGAVGTEVLDRLGELDRLDECV